jgi:pimeloyl-ACP methyl ester carboxylesterase
VQGHVCRIRGFVGWFDRVRKTLRPLGALAGLTGAAALLNRSLRTSGPLPTDHIGGVRRPWRWRGYDLFVTELAPPQPIAAEPVLLIHGIYAGASSYEYRKLAPLLARTRRVVVLDLLGCGLSEMPNLAYSPELFVENIVDALGELFEGPMTLVGSSLGGAFSIRAALRAPTSSHSARPASAAFSTKSRRRCSAPSRPSCACRWWVRARSIFLLRRLRSSGFSSVGRTAIRNP